MRPLQKLLLIVFCSAACGVCYCQDENDSSYMAGIPVKNLQLSSDAGHDKKRLAFGGISVIDARFDTTAVGFIKSHFPFPAKKMAFPAGTANGIEKYVAANYTFVQKTDSSQQLVVLLEKLWITSSYLPDKKEHGDLPAENEITIDISKNKGNRDRPAIKTGLIIKANVLSFKNGLYHPMYHVDTINISNASFINDEEAERLLEESVDNLLAKIADKNETELKISRKELSVIEITNYVNQKFTIPAITTALFTKGVYKTFDEFKNNHPSINNFTTGKNSKITDAMYVKDNTGNDYLLRDFWGYSDGKKFYINTGDNFFRLFKQGNSFVFYGFTSIIKKVYLHLERIPLGTSPLGLANGVMSAQDTKYKGIKTPLEVDMETGEAY